ncbi:MAG TPA: hypothetical protein PLP27_10900 [Crocinitomicaceae bacterium]|nr:hypothetical protein [Crocinitomicaceae bacterium]
MYKSELLKKYPELNARQLAYLLNVEMFAELSALGYKKNEKRLAPCVVRKFIELYGTPLNDEDFN